MSSLELMQGTLDMLVLRALARRDMHGYGISEWLRERTDGALEIGDAALYKAVRRLEARGWVEAEWGSSENNRRARYYSITPKGRGQLRTESRAFRRYVDMVFHVLDGAAE
jgi:transcriptional regulator